MLSPLTRKRLRAFRRNRRAWWSFIAFCAIFLFCLCADWVCPCDPQAVVDLKTLEKYRKPVVERTYEVKTARYNRLDSGEIVDFEGPEGILGSLGSKGAKESSAAIRQTAQYGAFSDVKGEVSHHTPERGLHTGRILYHIEGRIGVR